MYIQPISTGTTITSSIAQEAYQADYTHINESQETQKENFTMTQSKWIHPSNKTKTRAGKKTAFIQEQSYFFLAKNKKKQRMILTEELN